MAWEPVKYHLAKQQADALLRPVEATLRELTARADHYLEQMNLASPADALALQEASEALRLATARVSQAAAGGSPTNETPRSGENGKKRVLITGAGGRIGRDLAQRLQDRYHLRLMYHSAPPDTAPSAETVTTDIADLEAIQPALSEIDAVVHLAGEPDPLASWEAVLEANIIGTRNVFEAARRAGVTRIVFASTNHVMGMYDRDRAWPIHAEQPVRPDTLYGVSKAFGEALGRFYADQYGIGVICLRIGWMLAEPRDDIARWMWLSPRDCAQVVWRAIESDIPFGIFYAVSANADRHWDISDTMEHLGYRPQDDADQVSPEQ